MPDTTCPDLPPELARHPKFLILRELGRGGMGVVYQARQTMMNRPVVIKVINRALLDQPGTLERFHREVRAAAQLSHPNIVTAYDAEQAGELHMLVMEFVPGQSLAEVLQKKGPLPVAHACHYMRQVALGLQHAHERGMVHRDIKPQNLVLMPKGQVKILDFGLAKVVSERASDKGLTASNAYMGTPDYCSPEQATDARSADIRADLYSLGCTLYCLLAGRPPFQEETAVKTILAHLQKEPQPLPELRPDVPERLWRVVARLLVKEPGQRYQKPSEVVQALAPFVKVASKVAVPALQQDTMISADAGKVKEIQRKAAGGRPPREMPTQTYAGSPFENLVDTAPPKNGKCVRAVARKWLIGSGVMCVLLIGLLGLWASGVFQLKPKDGTIVQEKRREPGPVKSTPVAAVAPFGEAKAKALQKAWAEYLGRKVVEEVDLGGGVTMEFVLIPPGKFLMGSAESEKLRFSDETQHEVDVTRPFYLGVYEVTQEQYKKVMGENPSGFAAGGSVTEKVNGLDTRRFPVEMVSWEDARAFCEKLGRRSGRGMCLPSEAEWEYACRAGTTLPFHSGSELNGTEANSIKGSLGRTCRVGSYAANPWGLYDMHGNVCEWCADWYTADYYAKSPKHDPLNGDDGTARVVRGGSWNSYPDYCRAAYRNGGAPGYRFNSFGLRVCFYLNGDLLDLDTGNSLK
jgi:serine/threonine protein kinase/formylglycine-generating enzyme required for sulfatase activity